jgi:membrane-bound lytic murein transglycosylase B
LRRGGITLALRPRMRRPPAAALAALVAALLLVAACGPESPALRPAEPVADARAAGEPATPSSTRGGDGLPAVDEPVPRGPAELADTFARTRVALFAAVDRWRSEGDPARGLPPRDVARLALFHQRMVRRLARRPSLERAVLARLRGPVVPETRDLVRAPRELGQIRSVRRGPPPRIRIGASQPIERLRGHYQRAWRRFGVGPPLLAAVNFVETSFNELRNRSISGAQGPMQFIPATWTAYGMGGDIRDPRDAILGAANLLHANGAPARERRALFRYNPSARYVSAVSRYARRIRADERLLYVLYAWQVYVGGERRSSFGL